MSERLSVETLVCVAVAPLFSRNAWLAQMLTVGRVTPDCEEFKNSVVDGVVADRQLIDVAGSGRLHNMRVSGHCRDGHRVIQHELVRREVHVQTRHT